MLTGRRTDKQQVAYTHKGKLFTLKRKEIRTRANYNTGEDIMLRAMNQTQKDRHYIFHLHERPTIGRPIGKRESADCQVWGGRVSRESVLWAQGFRREGEKVLESDGAGGRTAV